MPARQAAAAESEGETTVPMTRRHSRLAGSILKTRFDPGHPLKRQQLTAEKREEIVRSINLKFQECDLEPIYSEKKLTDWVANCLYRYRCKITRKPPKSWTVNRRAVACEKRAAETPADEEASCGSRHAQPSASCGADDSGGSCSAHHASDSAPATELARASRGQSDCASCHADADGRAASCSADADEEAQECAEDYFTESPPDGGHPDGYHEDGHHLQWLDQMDVQASAQFPKSFLCPISREVMRDPVSAWDGHSYERVNIGRWLATHNTSPMTGAPLPQQTLLPNHALRNSIREYFDLHMHVNLGCDESEDAHIVDDAGTVRSEEEGEAEAGHASQLDEVVQSDLDTNDFLLAAPASPLAAGAEFERRLDGLFENISDCELRDLAGC